MVKLAAFFGRKSIEIISEGNLSDIYAFAQYWKNSKLLLEEVLNETEELALLNPDSVNMIRPICVLDKNKKVKLY